MKLHWNSCTKRVDQDESKENKNDDDDLDDSVEKMQIRRKNCIVVVTPQVALKLFTKVMAKKETHKCFSMVIDKLNMHQAFDLDQDLLEIVKTGGFNPTDIHFRMIFTTNDKGDVE